MRLVISLVIAVICGLLVIWSLPVLKGYVLVRAGGMAIETNVLILVLGMITFMLLLWLIVWLWRLPGNTLRKFFERRAQAQMEIGMLALSEGDWHKAEKALSRSAQYGHGQAVSYLGAAQAAEALGHTDSRENYLREADQRMQAHPGVKITRARIQLDQGKPDAAIEILEPQYKSGVRTHRTLALLAESYEKAGEWEKLAKLVPVLRKHEVRSEAEAQQLLISAIRHRLDESVHFEELNKVWRSLGRSQRKEPLVLARYAENAILFGRGTDVAGDVRSAINSQWSESLVDIYGRLGLEATTGQIKECEKWLQNHPESPALHLALGRLCQRRQLWGKAQDHLESSIRLRPDAQTYRALGSLHEREGNQKKAMEAYKHAANHALERHSRQLMVVKDEQAQLKEQ